MRTVRQSRLGYIQQEKMPAGRKIPRQYKPQRPRIRLGQRRHPADNTHRTRGRLPLFQRARPLHKKYRAARPKIERHRIVGRRHHHLALKSRRIKTTVRRR